MLAKHHLALAADILLNCPGVTIAGKKTSEEAVDVGNFAMMISDLAGKKKRAGDDDEDR